MRRSILCVLALAAVAAAASSAAQAKRSPTLAERGAVLAALPGYLRAEPVACTAIDITVSANGRWARAAPTFFPQNKGCARYAANGLFLLRRVAHDRWKVAYNGSDAPPCSLHVPRDLATCRPGP